MLRNLDIVRAFAALAVVFFHLGVAVPGDLIWLSKFGWIGVDLFFVVSGAVIASSAAERMRRGANWRAGFLAARVARVYPLYILTSTVALLLYERHSSSIDVVLEVVSHAFMLHTMHPSTFFGLNHVSWSLAIEFHFYLLVMLITPLMIKRAGFWFVVAGMFAISLSWNYGVRLGLSGDPDFMNMTLSQLPGRLDEFGWGLLIWKYWNSPGRKSESILLSCIGTTLIFCSIVLLYAWCSGVSGQDSRLAAAGLWIHAAVGDVFARALIGACCAGFVFGASLLREGRVWRPVSYLGVVSYGIYLWHPIAISGVASFVSDTGSFVVASLFLTVLLAMGSYHFIEVPSRSWIRSVFAPRLKTNFVSP